MSHQEIVRGVGMREEISQECGYSFEKRFGAILGLEVTRGSGNQWFAKGDLAGHGMLGELKYTGHQSFSVTKTLFRKLRDACRGGEEPFLAIDVDGEVFVVQRAGDWIAARTKPAEAAFIDPTRSAVKRATSRVPALLRDGD